MQIIVLLLLIGGGIWLYDMRGASGGMSGKTYYEACWAYKNKSAGFNTPVPSNPYESAQWKNCEPVAKRAFFDEGMVFSGRESDDDSKRLARVCPNTWSEVPMGGFHYMFIDFIEQQGGLNIIDGAMPATWSISRWAKSKWPHCAAERERQGYSKVMQKDDGDFGWSKPCPKCK